MAQGDYDSFVSSVLAKLPRNWFPDTAPVAGAIVSAIATVASFLWGQQATAAAQYRINTASGVFLRIAAEDFFGFRKFLPRVGETDDSYRARIKAKLLAPLGTRQAMFDVLNDLTGSPPAIFMPSTDGQTLGVDFFMDDPASLLGAYDFPRTVFIDVKRPYIVTVLENPSALDQCFMDVDAFMIPDSIFESTIDDNEITQAVLDTAPAGILTWLSINA